jgi:preprotein translocase subunit SecE
MDSQRQKWVNLSYLVFSALVAYVLFSISFKVAGKYDLETRVQQIDLWIRGGSLLIGAALFGFLYSHSKINEFMNEVVIELSRVTWPTRNETSKATIVVIIMVLISGVVLGSLDVFWVWLLKWVL